MSCEPPCDEAAHAVANDDDPVGVDAVDPGRRRCAKPGDSGLAVLAAVREAVVAGAAPGTTIAEGEHVPSGALDGPGEIRLHIVARHPLKQDDGRVRVGRVGLIDRVMPWS